ncbi:MAG: transcription repressor NadR [Lachnospiraceae bacterium]|nr:transcription repressor NadR [Lachnospiraceae bacterium]MDY4971271.1 transcription repressor NadR [Lachnospiraceae bacterium]
MNSEERRKEIIQTFRSGTQPVSGGSLSDMFGVSRQIIVQDIALLRAQGHDIISTNRGYLLKTPARVSRVFYVHHTDEQIGEELNAIVDLGGSIKDVFVVHKVYGTIRGDLGISSRRQVNGFLDQLKNGQSSPLKNITKDTHYHTVEAENEEILDEIEKELAERGFLLAD